MSLFVVVLPLYPLEEDDSFSVSDWPLHVTVVPTFSIDLSATDVAAEMATEFASHETVTVTAGEDELFGPLANMLVTVIDDSPALQSLHLSLTASLKALGATFESPEFVANGYRAHVTATQHCRLTAGDELLLEQLALVDIQPDPSTDRRRVTATFPLRGSPVAHTQAPTHRPTQTTFAPRTDSNSRL